MRGPRRRRKAAAEACSAEAKKAYKEYVQRVRDELLTLQKNSKKWWVKSGELTAQKAKVCHVPALKDSQGVWHRTAEEKAQLLADTFAKKYASDTPEDNKYS